MAEMHVERKSIRNFLASGKTFLIPEYQRPYSWKEEHCETLWEDIETFFKGLMENKELEDEYFLGSIVGFTDKESKNTLEIIDGQQRITTLNLLFRALYKKANDATVQTEDTKGYVKSFGKCIWKFDEGKEKLDYSKPFLISNVALVSDNEVLNKILSKDIELTENEEKSLYAKNFRFFCDKINEFVSNNIDSWKDFCDTILNKIFILPIECNNQENAMRIFTTLNDRGLPLSDSDIIKGRIYANLNSKEQKENFAKEWKNLESKLIDEDTNEKYFNMNFLFVQYTHVLRARDKDSSKEIGLRKFYMTSRYKEKLKNPNLMEEINELASFWLGEYDDKLSLAAKQLFDVLKFYPNEYWKALVSSYYFYCKDKKINFFDDNILLPFLQKSIANLLIKYINKATVNAIKDPVFNAYVGLYSNGELDFKTNTKSIIDNDNIFKLDFFKANKLTSSLITLNLYLKFPKQEIINDRQIEHIFPKRWQNTIFKGWDKKDAKEFLEQIGNKMWLEKRLNQQANNGFFGKKKEKYKKSKFLEAQELSNYQPKDGDWNKEDIENRNEEIYIRLFEFFKENV